MRADLRTFLTADPPPLNLVYLLAARSEQDDHRRRCRACEILLAPIELSGHVAFVGPNRSIVSPDHPLRIEFFQHPRKALLFFPLLAVTITRKRKRKVSVYTRLETVDRICNNFPLRGSF